MNSSEINLNAQEYTILELKEKFKLSDNYNASDVNHSVDRLVNIGNNTLAKNEKDNFLAFLANAKKRLLENTSTRNESYNYLNELLPSQRELTVIPQMHSAPPELSIHNNPEPIKSSADLVIDRTKPNNDNSMTIPIKKIGTRTKRLVKIDSQYRPIISTIDSQGQSTISGAPELSSTTLNTNFTINLSEPLDNVVSVRLYAINIPTTWYTFDSHLGNSLFSLDGNTTDCSSIEHGNYTHETLISELSSNTDMTFSIHPQTNKIVIKNDSEKDQSFLYYSKDGLIDNNNNRGGNYVDQNLGWHLGFRRIPDDSNQIKIDISKNDTITGDVPINVNGPKSMILALDDFNQHQHVRGFINVTDGNTSVTAIRPARASSKENQNLTKNQLYANQSLLEKSTDPNRRIVGPRIPDAFATISLQSINSLRPEPYVAYGGDLEYNERSYSGPVKIEKIKIRLFDDKGNLVNLNDNDWSLTLLVEQLF
tara:strand:+ start:1243 stop:2685 length:1443 start_codon:yes stop_codon:yes gene_type:complete